MPIAQDEGRKFTVLQMKTDGTTDYDVARELGISVSLVRQIVKEAADDAREQRRDLVDQQYMLHLNRTEFLYNVHLKRLKNFLAADKENCNFDRIMDTTKVLMVILERQAKLMGLDDKGTSTGGKRGSRDLNSWLSDPLTSNEDIVTRARHMGVPLPEEFSCPVNVA
jgi:hypothetical protein